MLNYLIYHQTLTFTVYHLFYYKGQNDLEILQKGESGWYEQTYSTVDLLPLTNYYLIYFLI